LAQTTIRGAFLRFLQYFSATIFQVTAPDRAFSVAFGAAFFTLIFYLPLYFQSVKGVSAIKFGIEVLPLLLSCVLLSMISGGLITAVGQFNPFALAGSVLFTIGARLLTTFTTTPFGKWFGYQVLTGIGVGNMFQIPLLAVQTCLPLEDVRVGTAIVMFFQTLGGTLFIAISQTVFQNGLIRGVNKFVPGLDPLILLTSGATEIRKVSASVGKLDQLEGALIPSGSRSFVLQSPSSPRGSWSGRA